MLEVVEALIERLKKETVTWEEAWKDIESWGKPWHSLQWKQRRDLLIQSACEQCGSTEPPMVLHHLDRFPTFRECRDSIQTPLWEKYKAENPILKPDLPLVDRNACPKCKSTAVRYYKRDTIWQCHGKLRGRECRFRFETPLIIQGNDPVAIRERSDLWQKNCSLSWDTFHSKYQTFIGIQATVLYLEHRRRYLSLANTTTFCKKCAFLWDKKGLRLCKQCSCRWHPLYLNRCATCKE